MPIIYGPNGEHWNYTETHAINGIQVKDINYDQLCVSLVKPKKLKTSYDKKWLPLHGKTITLQYEEKIVGFAGDHTKNRRFSATFVRKPVTSLNIVIKNVSRLDKSDKNLPIKFDESIFARSGKNIVVGLTKVCITEINRRPLKVVCGPDISKWPEWALKAHFVYKINKSLGRIIQIEPGRRTNITRANKESLLEAISCMRLAPNALVNKKRRELGIIGKSEEQKRQENICDDLLSTVFDV